jgi:hypothetical protein
MRVDRVREDLSECSFWGVCEFTPEAKLSSARLSINLHLRYSKIFFALLFCGFSVILAFELQMKLLTL